MTASTKVRCARSLTSPAAGLTHRAAIREFTPECTLVHII
jgi:hypothetical protein